jgi:hypothetical protein
MKLLFAALAVLAVVALAMLAGDRMPADAMAVVVGVVVGMAVSVPTSLIMWWVIFGGGRQDTRPAQQQQPQPQAPASTTQIYAPGARFVLPESQRPVLRSGERADEWSGQRRN